MCRVIDTLQSSVMTFDGLRFRFLFYCWGELLKCAAGMFTFLVLSKIHPNINIRDQNLSPSKVISQLCKVSMTLYSTCRYLFCISLNWISNPKLSRQAVVESKAI